MTSEKVHRQNEALFKRLEQVSQAYVAECRERWPMVNVGNYSQTFVRKNTDSLDLPFMGINKDKQLVPTVANMEEVDKRKYCILRRGEFVFSGMQTGRDICIRITLSEFRNDVLLSPAYTTFFVRRTEEMLPEFLFLSFKSSEKDRLGWFKSDSSVRANLDWDRFCEIKIPLPPIEVQRAYVKAYKGLTALIEQNEALLKRLEQASQACVAECRERWPMVALVDLILECNDRNSDMELNSEDVAGIATSKEFIGTKADLTGVNVKGYKIVREKDFAFVSDTSRRGEKMSLAFNSLGRKVLVTSIATVLRVIKPNQLCPEYLFLQFKRPEFDRYARFNSWGSARETFSWDDMCRVKIPLPPIEVQRAIVALYRCAEEARQIASEAKRQLDLACPAMIQRASHVGG